MPEKQITTAAIYARVSTKDKGQDTQNQLAELRRFCKVQGWKVHREYIDNVSAKTANRPEFQSLMTDAARRNFDIVLFWALDRFSREGVLATLQHLQRLTDFGVGWKSFTEQYLDSCGIFRDAVLSILATIAKQERVRLSERTVAGLATARAKGKILGRPQRVFRRDVAEELRAKGMSWRKIEKELGVPQATIRKALAERKIRQKTEKPRVQKTYLKPPRKTTQTKHKT